jgi:metallo-beta-lactamase family protein
MKRWSRFCFLAGLVLAGLLAAPAADAAKARLRSLGAANGTVTGSMHELEVGSSRILVDAGMFQGRGGYQRNLSRSMPASVNSVVITHDHIDHIGWLPRLYAEGYRGPIYATPVSVEMMAPMLRDSAKLQERDPRAQQWFRTNGKKGRAPLYTMDDAEGVLSLLKPIPRGQVFNPAPGLTARFGQAAHIAGSAPVRIGYSDDYGPGEVIFSGDWGRRKSQMMPSPEIDFDPAIPRERRTLVIESTYGGRLHPVDVDSKVNLERIIKQTAARGGKVMIGAFSLGRTQQLIYQLHQLHVDGKLPRYLPIYVDAKLGTELTEVLRRHPEEFNDEVNAFAKKVGDIYSFPRLQYTPKVEDSKKIGDMMGPAVIIAGSGMATGGRILYHLRNYVSDPRNTYVASGFQAPGTTGRELEDGAKFVKVLGTPVEVRAKIESLPGMSSHGDREDLLWLARGINAGQYHITHGDLDQSQALRDTLRAEGRRADVAQEGAWLELTPEPAQPAAAAPVSATPAPIDPSVTATPAPLDPVAPAVTVVDPAN